MVWKESTSAEWENEDPEDAIDDVCPSCIGAGGDWEPDRNSLGTEWWLECPSCLGSGQRHDQHVHDPSLRDDEPGDTTFPDYFVSRLLEYVRELGLETEARHSYSQAGEEGLRQFITRTAGVDLPDVAWDELGERLASNLQVSVVDGDITKLEVDAIVNAANGDLILGSGVAGAIRRNGGPDIQADCDLKAPIPVGQAVETTAGDLPSTYVIHAVTMEHGGGESEAETIEQATLSSLKLADSLGCHSIALPAFGTGVGRFDVRQCAQIMTKVVKQYQPSTLTKVIFSVWGEDTDRAFREALANKLSSENVDHILNLIDQQNEPYAPHQPTWSPQLSPGVLKRIYDEAMYKHRCPQCSGYFRDRGDVWTCDSCGFDYDPRA